jgi:nucleoside-diphosphate-sugar epimerase
MDYYGIPHIDTHMPLFVFAVDMKHKIAGIPGTGNEPICLTYSQDMAKFVVASLDLPKWEEDTFCYSDRTTFNELLNLAQEATGLWIPKFSCNPEDLD